MLALLLYNLKKIRSAELHDRRSLWDQLGIISRELHLLAGWLCAALILSVLVSKIRLLAFKWNLRELSLLDYTELIQFGNYMGIMVEQKRCSAEMRVVVVGLRNNRSSADPCL